MLMPLFVRKVRLKKHLGLEREDGDALWRSLVPASVSFSVKQRDHHLASLRGELKGLITVHKVL